MKWKDALPAWLGVEETPPGLPLTEIAGDRRVLIENHLGITEYGPEKIQVRVRFGAICVQGCGLRLALMAKDRLVIFGEIRAVQFLRGCRP